MKTKDSRAFGAAVGCLAFLAAFVFFQFFYPYHLMRREQMNLFLYDWDYIRQTYRGAGWLSSFISDFADQFFCLRVVGPVIVALTLTAIGFVAYRICRHFLGRWPSLAVGAAFFVWAFFRETENLYCTRYTVAFLGYLLIILAALQFRKPWMKGAALAVFAALAAYPLGKPFEKYYGEAWGWPKLRYDKVIGLDTEVYLENWDTVVKRSEKDLHIKEASYCYNLAHAMKGDLGQSLLKYSQSDDKCLFLWISSEFSQFTCSMAGEAWFHLGDMTLAEQSAIIALQATPKHTGARYILRMAKVNLVTGEEGAAQKYLGLLSKTLFYGKWARRMLDGQPDAETAAWLEGAKSRLAKPESDFVYVANLFRPVLKGLLDANPSNSLAHEYLLCYDLLTYDLDHFMEDYDPETDISPIYDEAVVVWLSSKGMLTEDNSVKYGVKSSTLNKLDRYLRYPDNYKDTYWHFYSKALNAQ